MIGTEKIEQLVDALAHVAVAAKKISNDKKVDLQDIPAAMEVLVKIPEIEQFVAAFISSKVQKIQSEHKETKEARDEIIKAISLARAQRDSIKLRAYNRTLWLVDNHLMQQHKDQAPTDPTVRGA